MGYRSAADMSVDSDLRNRIVACAAIEGVEEPWPWVESRSWKWVVQPGWDEAYSEAQSAQKPRPGADEAVITDEMILTAVQLLRAESETSTPGDV